LPDLDQRRGIWKRYLAGALVVIVAAAGATSVTAFNQVDRIAKVFGGQLDLDEDLAEAAPGEPQTILLIGSDRRAKTSRDAQLGSGVRSDTMILMRLDPSKDAIALLSLPRDLKVHIPGHGVDKLNIAYAEGGTKLALRTIKQFTGLRVNHVINVDFGGFKGAIDAIHCVYVDVDRKYFNDNSQGGEPYATIDVEPGYQKLCGQDALDYVRYRHTDNDIIRAARQQDFLRQAKAQVGVGRLIDDRDKLVRVISKYTRSDIKGRKQVLSLLRLAIGSAGHPISEIHFPARIGKSYVTARQSSVKKVTRKFLGVEASSGPRGPAEPRRSAPKRRKRPSGSDALISVTPSGKQQALTIAREARGYKIYYPRLIVPRSSFSYASPRAYRICGPNGGKCYQSYRIVLSRDLIGEYYGVQGTTWRDPPILNDPSEKREYKGRDFELFYDGDRLRLVAWREKDAVYWVSNTLLQTLSEKQMLEIARAATPL
jgi:polyisoprenyl-teichoic acid--peptidoglycan teichoic acid transferase